MITEKQQSLAAAEFANHWSGKGYEKGDTQKFWLELLQKVYGVEDPYSFVEFEDKVMVDSTNFMDVYLPATRVLVEQKSIDKNLGAPIHQSDGAMLNPFQQAKRYIAGLPLSRHPRWVVTCNFAEFWVYDMEQPNGEPQKIKLKELEKDHYRLQFLVDTKSEHITKEMQVSMQAGEIVGRIYDALLKQYDDPSPEALRWLNILCVRIVFCLYAEDAGIFVHDQFHDYLERYDAEDLRSALIRLFETLDTPQEKRSKYLKEDLKAFPYTNGGLFAEEIEIPQFTPELEGTLLDNASLDFDWSEISPTIFGAVFESTLNPETRRSGGMHYTSIENIHKLIDPLFLNDLRKELDTILEWKVEKERNKRLDAYQNKISSLTFLDPACGSGNFLTETYLSLRRLENEVIVARHHGQSFLGFDEANPIKVSINQFYGIEINDFAVTVATTALWISEAQMLRETEKIVQHDIDFLPLKSYSNIREGNALRMEWDELPADDKIPTLHIGRTYIIPETPPLRASESGYYEEATIVSNDVKLGLPEPPQPIHIHYDYIIGNPPFQGARLMNEEQKQDVINVFGSKWKNVGNLDYVCCWYKKAAELMSESRNTRTAFVSTNSICQGEQVANLWQSLLTHGLHIDFAHRTFRWDSESSLKAHVHCIIVSFSYTNEQPKIIFDRDIQTEASNINAYLIDAEDVFVGSRQNPLCDVPGIGIGNKPIDGGNYLFTQEEMDVFIKQEPSSAKYFRPWYGADEFINNRPRYCLWLGDCTPAELRSMPHCIKRVEAVRNIRLDSKSAGTRKLADRPTRFHVENMPKGNYIIVPSVSSEKRRYVPMGFLSSDNLASNLVLVIPDATLFHFGILESNVHMAWMRAVCGRLKSDYRYSKDIVYNNFPWPKPTDAQMVKIEQTAQRILDARAQYPDSSLADLYDELTMPIELRKAHQDNDRAVMEAYGFPVKSTFTESQCVAELFKMYQELTQKQ